MSIPHPASRQTPTVRPLQTPVARRLAGLLLLASVAASVLPAQVRRGLVVGVNDYEAFIPATAARTATGSSGQRTPAPGARSVGPRGTISNLEGSVNDAQAIAQVMTARFGFRRTDVRVLTDKAATRKAILDSLTAMLDRSKPGDVAFFSFAGHGALRRNTLTPGKQVDQTLVPVDANAGAEDIRDKELAAILSPAAARGVIVTVVIDACNSGSITRGGVPQLLRERWASIDERDKAERYTGAFPADMGALVISAAEDTRPAKEGTDENNVRHGLFTAAFLQALLSTSINATAQQVFQSTKAIMQGRAPDQVPSIDAQPARLRQPIFGGNGSDGGRTTVAVTQLRGDKVEVDGGLALGLRPGTELARLVRGKPDTSYLIRVERNTSIARSLADIVSGNEDSLKVGDLYTITRWVTADEPLLRVWVPAPLATDADRDAAVAEARVLRASSAITWVQDPTRLPSATQPLVTVAFEGGWWTLRTGRERPVQIGATLKAARVLSAIGQLGIEKPAVWLSIPPTRALDAALGIGGATQAAGIARETAPDGAFYVLAGRVTDTEVEYSWVRANASAGDSTTSAFPARSNWFASSVAAGDSLRSRAEALGRMRTWLSIAAPPDDGQFPYRLVVVDSTTQQPFGTDSIRVGASLQLRMERDSARMVAAASRQPRFVYVFNIDNKGKATLLFPADGTNASNRVPYFMGNREVWPDTITVTDKVGQVATFFSETAGVESLLMVTSEQELPRDVFEWDGVLARSGARGGADTGVEALLRSRMGGTRSLGARAGSAPATWSLQRVQVRVVPRQ